jgi:hypothetical protein
MLVVLALPTMRTVMMDKPELTEPARSPIIMARMGLSIGETIRQHEHRMKQYKQESGNFIKTNQPTYLVSRIALCAKHRTNFRLTNWMKASDLKTVQEAAKTKGFHIPNPLLLPVEFKPLGWKPSHKWLELDRI